MKITFQGVLGAYSHLAAQNIFPMAEYIGCATFAQATEAVFSGKADYAVLPIENSTAGKVAEMHKLLPHIKLLPVGEYFLRVRHQLIGLPDAELSDIVAARSHIQALKQCSTFLQNHNITAIEGTDTAKSCAEIKAAGDKTRAAIASSLAAEIYELKILAPDIENNDDNTTHFIVWTTRENMLKNGESPLEVRLRYAK